MEPPKPNNITNKLIFIICCSIIGFVAINFISCTFLIPGTLQKALISKLDKSPIGMSCAETEKMGYETLLTVLTTVIALKTKMD